MLVLRDQALISECRASLLDVPLGKKCKCSLGTQHRTRRLLKSHSSRSDAHAAHKILKISLLGPAAPCHRITNRTGLFQNTAKGFGTGRAFVPVTILVHYSKMHGVKHHRLEVRTQALQVTMELCRWAVCCHVFHKVQLLRGETFFQCRNDALRLL